MIKITASESDLLHAAAGMDLFWKLEEDRSLVVTFEEAEGLVSLGLLYWVSDFSAVDHAKVKITEHGLTTLNDYIGRKRKC